MSVLLLYSQRKLLSFDPHYPANLQQEAQHTVFWSIVSFWLEIFSLSKRTHMFLSATNTENKHIRMWLRVPQSSSICHGSVSSIPGGRKKRSVSCSWKVNAPQPLCAEQTPRGAAEGREDRLHTAHPGRSLSDGYTPSLLDHSVFQVAVRPASWPARQPGCVSQLTASVWTLHALTSSQDLLSCFSSVVVIISNRIMWCLWSTAELHGNFMRISCPQLNVIALRSSPTESWIHFLLSSCLILIFSLMMTTNSLLIIPRFLLMDD